MRRELSKSLGLIVAVSAWLAISGPSAIAAGAPRTGIVAAYTLVVPNSIAKSHLQARAVIPTGNSCPKVVEKFPNGMTKLRAMTMRVPGATTGPAFASLRSCQANLNSGLAAARVGAVFVPSKFAKTFDKIAVLGDTGCRVKKDLAQNCRSPIAWPLARNAQSVANAEPDVIFFTGDFFYREAACPLNRLTFCGGSPPPAMLPAAGQAYPPMTDTDYGWVADALAPMAPAFAAAPLLVTRGNHESCFRGGNGWMLLFEIQLKPDSCAPTAQHLSPPDNIDPTYSVDFPISRHRKLRVIMVDSSGGVDREITPNWVALQRPAYQQAARLAAGKPGRESWLMTHRPMFGLDSVQSVSPGELNWTSADQAGAALGLTSNFNLMLASHIHVAQVVQMPSQPAQLIFGNGGSMPDTTDPADYPIPAYGPLNTSSGQPIDPDYPPINQLPTYTWTTVKYGHAIFTPKAKAGEWSISQKDATGRQFASCTAAGKQFTCE